MVAMDEEIKQDYVDVYLNDILDGHFSFYNRELVSYIYPYIKQRYPEAVLIDLITSQYIIIKREHLDRLRNMLRKKMAKMETEMNVLLDVMSTL